MPRSFRPAVAPLESRETPSIVSATGAAADSAAWVSAYDESHHELFRVAPYGESFTGGIRTAIADVDGDGEKDLIVSPGTGIAPTVVAYNGRTFAEMSRFDAFESTFHGGVNLAAADLNGDGKSEIIMGADDSGGPRLRILDGATVQGNQSPTALMDFIAIMDPDFRGGIRLGVGDLNGDGVADVAVGAGNGGGPRVAVYDGKALALGLPKKVIADFFSHEASLRAGTQIDVEDVTGDGINDLVFGATSNGRLRDRYISGAELQNLSVDSQSYEFFLSNLVTTLTDSSGNTLTKMIPYITPYSNPKEQIKSTTGHWDLLESDGVTFTVTHYLNGQVVSIETHPSPVNTGAFIMMALGTV